MKQFKYLITFFVLLGSTRTVFAQEEFFGNQSGFSFAYSKVITMQENSVAASLYLKNKMIIGINSVSIYNKVYPVFTLIACPNWGYNPKQAKFGFGLTYGYVNEKHLIGLNLIVAQPFFAESEFPFSIQGSVVVLTNGEKLDSNVFDLLPAVGIGYTQTFFATNRVYPLIGLSYSTDLQTKSGLYSAHIGINIKLGTKAEKN